MKYVFLTFAIAALTACEAVMPAPVLPSVPAVPNQSEDTCNAGQYADLIGQDATALERVLILGQVRVIRPGSAVTMDYRPDRINFNIDGANRIASITCT